MLTHLFATLMNRMQLENEEGQDLAEYALIVVLIAVVAVTAVTLLGTNVAAIFTQITGLLPG